MMKGRWGRIWLRGLVAVLMAKLLILGAIGLDFFHEDPFDDLVAASSQNGTAAVAPKGGNSVDEQCCNPELLRLLRLKMARLDEREKQLDKKEQDLLLLKKDIDEKIKRLRDLQRKLEGPVKKKRLEEGTRLQHLAGVYSSMDPVRAAALLDKLDEDTVTRLFAIMKSKKVAKILANMSPEKAARISERLYGKNQDE